MKALRRIGVVILIGSVLGGCASFDAGPVRELSQAEIDVFEATRGRLKANRPAVEHGLDDLATVAAYALSQQHGLSASIAKARLLESMKSPWSNTRLPATQREVALYHLYALSEAEEAVFAARLQERQAAIANVKRAYGNLVTSMGSLVATQKQLLGHLNQPASARLVLYVNTVLQEAKAFREALNDDDPALVRLGEAVMEKEQAVEQARDNLVELLSLSR